MDYNDTQQQALGKLTRKQRERFERIHQHILDLDLRPTELFKTANNDYGFLQRHQLLFVFDGKRFVRRKEREMTDLGGFLTHQDLIQFVINDENIISPGELSRRHKKLYHYARTHHFLYQLTYCSPPPPALVDIINTLKTGHVHTLDELESHLPQALVTLQTEEVLEAVVKRFELA